MFKKLLKILFGVLKAVLVIAVVSAVFLLIFTVFNPVKEFRVLKVMSGSMEPAIKVGSIVFVKKTDANELKVGDIITYKSDGESGVSITHRLVGIENKDDSTVFKTKGDANNIEDTSEVLLSQVEGKVMVSVPLLGYLSDWVRKPLGFTLLIILPSVLLIISEIFNIKKTVEEEVEKKYAEKKRNTGDIDSLITVALLMGGFFFFTVGPTVAYFSDKAVIEDITFSMSEYWDSPSDVVINEIMWGGSSEHELDEWIELRNTTDRKIDLTGWEIKSAGPSDKSIILTGEIEPNGYYLITHFPTDRVDGSSVKSAVKDSIDEDLIDKNLNLKDIGEQLILVNSFGMEIDRTPEIGKDKEWAEGSGGPHGPWKSMERDSEPGDGDDKDNWYSSFCNSDEYWEDDDNYGTPKSENSSEEDFDEGGSSDEKIKEKEIEVNAQESINEENTGEIEEEIITDAVDDELTDENLTDEELTDEGVDTEGDVEVPPDSDSGLLAE